MNIVYPVEQFVMSKNKSPNAVRKKTSVVSSNITEESVRDISFILTNKKGGYLYLAEEPLSRYNGFFCYEKGRMIRSIESIQLMNSQVVECYTNKLHTVERKRGNIIESFFVPENFNSFVYEISKMNPFLICFDFKESYDNRQFGRFYEIKHHGSFVIVKFTKRKSIQEDGVEGIEEYSYFVVIKSNSKVDIIDKWHKRDYEYDKQRNSFPAERYVYQGVMIYGNLAVFSFGSSLNRVMDEANFIFYSIKGMRKKEEKSLLFKMPQRITNQKNPQHCIAYCASAHSIKSLLVQNDKISMFAGLPWFFQFWSRDELVSCKSLMLLGFKRDAEQILRKYIHALGIYGNLGNKYPNPDIGSADAIGWLFVRIADYLSIYNNKSEFSVEISSKYKERFIKAVEELIIYHTQDGMAKNYSKETWMDTDFDGDNRSGFRIEIQALRLFIYKFMFILTNDKRYSMLESSLRKLVREKFWNNSILADGLNDWTVRPNVFIALYVYPELLSRFEWEICIENSLKELWLDFGGIASISKSNRLFTPYHTGENPKSYHRGDSWFWINNLSAIVMNRINNKKFKENILKILSASEKEILFSGALARHAEISSASALRSEGCLMQAWSSALFIELIEEIFGSVIE